MAYSIQTAILVPLILILAFLFIRELFRARADRKALIRRMDQYPQATPVKKYCKEIDWLLEMDNDSSIHADDWQKHIVSELDVSEG